MLNFSLVYDWIMDNKLWIILAFATICNYFWLSEPKNKNKLKLQNNLLIVFISLIHTVIGLLFVKFFAIAEVGFDLEKAGSMSLYGGVFFMPLFYFVLAKLTHTKLSDVFDVFSISIISTLMLSRFNCILSGCCSGKPIFNSTTLYWPTREMEIIFYIIMIYVLEKKISSNKSNGKAYPIYMVSYGVFRGITETLRLGEGLIHRAHFWSLISIVIGIIILLNIKKSQKKEVKK